MEEQDDPAERVITLYKVLNCLEEYNENGNNNDIDARELNMFLKSIIKRIEVNAGTNTIAIVWTGYEDTDEEKQLFNKRRHVKPRYITET